MNEFLFKPDAPRALEKTLALLQEVWPNDKSLTLAYLRWLYLENPAGKAIGFQATNDEGELVGHYVVIPMFARFGANEPKVFGALSLHTAVSAKARGLGLFTKLARATFDEAERRGCRFIAGVANANSVRGFEKMGFKNYGSLDAKIGFLAPKRASVPAGGFRRDWDEESISWRLNNPSASYRVDSKTGLIFRRWRGLFDVLLGEAGPAKRVAHLAPIVFIGRRADLAFPRYRFFDIPKKLRPSPLHLIYLSLGNLPDPGEPVWNAMDFDAF